jgi:hypothetical protein
VIARTVITLAVTQWCLSAVQANVQLEHATPAVTFGPGQHRVGASLASGRYFARPATGCFWERQSSNRRIAFGFVGFDAQQWIVDIPSTDHVFTSNEACGRWSNRMIEGQQRSIGPGLWIVGQQVLPGMYTSSVGVGCYWERLMDFAGASKSIVASELIAAPGIAFVTIFDSDAGFRTDASCGSWTIVDAPVAPSAETPARIH